MTYIYMIKNLFQECVTRESKGGKVECGGHICVAEKKEQRKL